LQPKAIAVKKYAIRTSTIYLLVLLSSILVLPDPARAQDSLLVDQNGDGAVSCLAFGDSITYGLGDNIAPGVTVDPLPIRAGGYPVRVAQAAGIPVENSGVPGEFFTQEGIDRLAATVSRSSADLVLVLEGANDSFLHQNASDYEVKMQKAVNVIIALGRAPVLATLPSPCCTCRIAPL
jgi:lysophospholipase L1-like esterase